MAKPPPVECFDVTFKFISQADLGSLMAAGIKLGHENVVYNLVTHVPTFAQRKNHDTSSEEVLAAWVKDHPTFRAIEAVRHFEANGRTKGAAYPALTALIEKGILKKLEPGHYSRADVKHLAAPKKRAKGNGKRQKHYDITNGEFILRYARRSHGRLNRNKMQEVFKKEGRMASSVSPTLNDLIAKKLVKRIGDGEYVLLNKATPKAAPKKVEPKVEPQINDASVAEMTHG